MIPFLKREKANEEKRMPLWSDDGQDYYLTVVSNLSDKHRMNKSLVFQEAAQNVGEGKLDDSKKAELTAKLCACSVTGWELPEEFGEFTQEKAGKFLFDYPQICDTVDRFCSALASNAEKK